MDKSVESSKYDKKYFGERYQHVDYKKVKNPEEFGHIYQKSASMLILNENDRVVDLGCGSGQLSFLLYLKYGCDITGVDYSSDAIYFCEKNLNILESQKKYSDIKNKVRFLHCDNINLPDFKGVKAVFLIDVVEHLFDEEIEFILKKIKTWRGEKEISVVIKTDNNNYLRFIDFPLKAISVFLGKKTWREIKEDREWNLDRHVNLTTASRLKRKLFSLGYQTLKVKYPSLENKIIKAQLGALGKYKILVWLAFILGKPLYFLRPSFTILAVYRNSGKVH